MLGCTCMIHLGIQWPKVQCSRAYAQHQHGMLQGLCPTFPIIFSCVPKLYAQHKCKFSCAPEPLAQHKTSHRSCTSGSTPNTNISSIMCFRVHTQNKTYIYIYIINNWITSNIQKKSSCLDAVGSLTQYKIKHQYNHHGQ